MKKITFSLIILLVTTISYSQDIFINQNFNGPTLPAAWRASASSDSGNGTQIWTFGSGVVPGFVADFSTNAAIFNDRVAGSTLNHDKVWLWYRTPNAVGIDVTSYNDVILEYDYALNSRPNHSEKLTVGLWNGSDTFIPIRVYNTDTNPTSDFINIKEALALHPEVDASALFIGFGYDDVDSVRGWGAGIDNVKLTGYNAPTNNECVNAEIINDGATITATTYGSTNADALTLCEPIGGGGLCTNGGDGFTNFGLGVWYVYTSTTSETITISTENVATNFDTELQVWSGSCGALTCIGSDDDSGDGSNGEDSILCWQSTGSALDPVDYYIYVDGDSSDRGDFVLTLNTDQSTASNEAFEQFDFSIYPNPIKNTLSIDSQEIITKVTIFNLLGQEVKSINPYTNNVSVDINNLEAGIYIIKLIANDKESTKKFIKEG